MDPSLRRFVRHRAGERCEYCRLHQIHCQVSRHVDHIVAKQHGGPETPDNLALACLRCNLCKGPNLTGIDPTTMQVVALFHPRQDRWADHFAYLGARIGGLTPTGRATVELLERTSRAANKIQQHPARLDVRSCWS